MRVMLASIVALLLAAPAIAQDAAWTNLFDGRTLNGWVQRGGNASYTVEDGQIVGRSVPNTPNSFLCTERDYGDFILELEFKVDPTLNSGVQIRSESRPDYRDGRVHGYQVEIDPSPRAWSGGIYDESRRGWINNLADNEAARQAFKASDWNHFRVEAIGDSIKTWINGVPAADMVDSMTLSGFIGLQVHGIGKRTDTLEVRWRNVRIQDLGRREWQPIFDGKSLGGWHTLPGGKWAVQDGVIVGTSSKDETRHGMLISDSQYGDFTVRLKFRPVAGNSGFYFRAEKVEHRVGVHGFQAEINQASDTGGLYETGGRKWVVQIEPELLAKSFKPGEWNEMTVSARGERIVVHVNGIRTADFRDETGRRAGHFGLQLHGNQDMHVEFKDIEILSEPIR